MTIQYNVLLHVYPIYVVFPVCVYYLYSNITLLQPHLGRDDIRCSSQLNQTYHVPYDLIYNYGLYYLNTCVELLNHNRTIVPGVQQDGHTLLTENCFYKNHQDISRNGGGSNPPTKMEDRRTQKKNMKKSMKRQMNLEGRQYQPGDDT